MKLSRSHADSREVSDLSADLMSREKLRDKKGAKKFGGVCWRQQQRQRGCLCPELGLEVCVMRTGPALFRAPGLWCV